jgi:hypothetical protein
MVIDDFGQRKVLLVDKCVDQCVNHVFAGIDQNLALEVIVDSKVVGLESRTNVERLKFSTEIYL